MKESFAGRGALKHSAAVDSAPRRKGVDRRRHRFIQCLLRMASLLLAVTAVGAAAIPVAAARSGQRQPEYSTFEQLGGKTISMLTGAPFEELIGSKVPDVGEFTYYSAPAELLLALRTGKTDAFLNNSAIAALYVNKYKDIAQFPEPLKEAQFGVGFSKKYKKLAEWKKAFAELDPDEIEAVWNKWTSADESKKLPLKQDWAGKAGKVRVAVGDSMQPASYVNAAGDVLGMEAEIILMMAKKLDYKVEFMPMEFASLIATVESGKADLCAGSLIITEERKKVLDFLPYHETAFVLVVRAKTEREETPAGFWESLKDKLRDTLVTDGRYRLILSGLGTTLLISLCSGAAGLILAFGMASLRRRNIRAVNSVIAGYCRLVAGLPVVVILMILYYVVFGSTIISPALVATLGFTLIFAPKAYALINNAVDAVDSGQLEGALALGYSRNQAYRRVILPQARKIYFPLLRTQFSLLVKETSVVGYIAVVDLTRAGDIIRGHTLDAFFPLLIIAVVYFFLTWLMSAAIDAGSRALDRLMKGGAEQ